MKLRCLIADDEYPARKLLEEYIAKIPALQLVATCENALEANDQLEKNDIDLMFLDIQMPDLTGLELLKTLPAKPFVILTTAYSDYALEGYELDVADYLLKPFSFERFVQAVNKVIERKGSGLNQQTGKDHFFVKADYKKVRVNYSEIRYVEGLREYISIYTANKRIITLESMKNMEQILPADNFIRIHKSYIVALDKVNAIMGNVLELGEQKIPIGKSYREQVMKLFEV